MTPSHMVTHVTRSGRLSGEGTSRVSCQALQWRTSLAPRAEWSTSTKAVDIRLRIDFVTTKTKVRATTRGGCTRRALSVGRFTASRPSLIPARAPPRTIHPCARACARACACVYYSRLLFITLLCFERRGGTGISLLVGSPFGTNADVLLEDKRTARATIHCCSTQ